MSSSKFVKFNKKVVVTHEFSYGNKKGKFYNARSNKYCSGYSGDKDNYNDASKMYVQNKGPLPFGKYRITKIGNYRGPLTSILKPIDNTVVKGRFSFLIHGDNKNHNFTGSKGCIIIDISCRENIKENDIILVKSLN